MSSRHVFVLIAAGLLLTRPASSAIADSGSMPAPPVSILARGLTTAQAGDFRAALDALADQGHVAIVAEGAPLTPTLEPEKAPKIPVGTLFSDALSAVAAAYDYDAVLDGNVCLLTKRYTDPNDLPCVSLGECSQALDDIEDLLTPLDKLTSSDAGGLQEMVLARDIADSLTPDEMQALAGSQGLLVSDLNPYQEEAVRQWGLAMYLVGPISRARCNSAILQEAESTSVGMGLDVSPLGTFPMFGRRAPGYGGIVAFYSFNYVNLFMGGKPIDDSVPDESMPQPANGAVFPDSDRPIAIKQAAANLSSSACRFSVEPALAAKPVTIAGQSNVPAGQLFDSLAALYGLSVLVLKDGSKHLAFHSLDRPLDATDVMGLRRALHEALPGPVQRACHVGYFASEWATSSSWLNLVELWFRDLTQKRIRRGAFRSVPDLVAVINAYVHQNNLAPKPFIWSASVASILEKVAKCQDIYETHH